MARITLSPWCIASCAARDASLTIHVSRGEPTSAELQLSRMWGAVTGDVTIESFNDINGLAHGSRPGGVDVTSSDMFMISHIPSLVGPWRIISMSPPVSVRVLLRVILANSDDRVIVGSLTTSRRDEPGWFVSLHFHCSARLEYIDKHWQMYYCALEQLLTNVLLCTRVIDLGLNWHNHFCLFLLQKEQIKWKYKLFY